MQVESDDRNGRATPVNSRTHRFEPGDHGLSAFRASTHRSSIFLGRSQRILKGTDSVRISSILIVMVRYFCWLLVR